MALNSSIKPVCHVRLIAQLARTANAESVSLAIVPTPTANASKIVISLAPTAATAILLFVLHAITAGPSTARLANST